MNEMVESCTCKEFAARLASSAPTPGGGGASALVGALGAALGSMVANLTVGKKKYAAVEEDMHRLLEGTDWPVAKVGRQCGFKEMGYFARAFREVYHCTPMEHRRAILQKKAGGTAIAP